MADLLKAAKDPKFREDVIRGLGETFSRGVAGIVGAPVDIATMAMRPFGYNVPAEQVVGGSEYIGKQMEEAGLISSARRPAAEFLANVVTPDPMDVARLGAMAVPVVGRAMREAPRDEAMRIAQANAAKPVSEGGLGLPPDNTAMDRAKAMGFDVENKFIHSTSKPFEQISEKGRFPGVFTLPNESADYGSMDMPFLIKGDIARSSDLENFTTQQARNALEGKFSRKKIEMAINQEIPKKITDPADISDAVEEMQKIRMRLAKEMGYPAVTMSDEFSNTVAILPTSNVRSTSAAFDPAKRYESDLLGAADPRLLEGVAGATGAGLYGANRMQEGEERPQPRFGFRPDGTPKGEGWLGVLPLSDGNVATEYSMQSQAVKVGDQMVDFPTLVPTLNQEEVNLMLSDIIPNRKPIPEPIVQKAIKHAKQRLDKGLSPFKELGE